MLEERIRETKELTRALLVALITRTKAAEIESKAMVVRRGNRRGELRLAAVDEPSSGYGGFS